MRVADGRRGRLKLWVSTAILPVSNEVGVALIICSTYNSWPRNLGRKPVFELRFQFYSIPDMDKLRNSSPATLPLKLAWSSVSQRKSFAQLSRCGSKEGAKTSRSTIEFYGSE